MLEIERHEMILRKLEETGKLSYENIEKFLNVSIATIRRDVEKLSKKDLLNKVNGGVVSKKRINFELEVAEKFEENIEEKKKIAKKAAKLVKKGDFIYLDAGTTTYYMIEYLKDKNVSVVTNGLMHLDKLLLNNIKTIIVGGEVKTATKAVAGIEALKNIEKYRFDKSFIGVNGISIEYGFMTPDINEALLKEKVIEISNKTYILADQKKFNELSSVKFADIKKCKIITSELKDEIYKNYTIEEEEK